MSEQVQVPVQAADVHAPSAAAVAVPAVPFSEKQIDQFDADDGDAGRAIGKMLALFFLYTVVVMSGVGYWTLRRPASNGQIRRAERPSGPRGRGSLNRCLVGRTGPPSIHARRQ